jgi:hypothetical protein
VNVSALGDARRVMVLGVTDGPSSGLRVAVQVVAKALGIRSGRSRSRVSAVQLFAAALVRERHPDEVVRADLVKLVARRWKGIVSLGNVSLGNVLPCLIRNRPKDSAAFFECSSLCSARTKMDS